MKRKDMNEGIVPLVERHIYSWLLLIGYHKMIVESASPDTYITFHSQDHEKLSVHIYYEFLASEYNAQCFTVWIEKKRLFSNEKLYINILKKDKYISPSVSLEDTVLILLNEMKEHYSATLDGK